MRSNRNRRRSAACAVAVLTSGFAAARADESTAVAEQAASCEGCHQAGTSLVGKPVDIVTATIRVIADGDSKHPPIHITLDLDDRNIEALAKALTGAQ